MVTQPIASWQSHISQIANVYSNSRAAPNDVGLGPSRPCACCKQWKCRSCPPGPRNYSLFSDLPLSASLEAPLDGQLPTWGAQATGDLGFLADVADPRWFLISSSTSLVLAAWMAMYISRPRGWADLSLLEVGPRKLKTALVVSELLYIHCGVNG